MIDREDYRLPKEQPKKRKTKADATNENILYSLGFRPFGYEW